MTMEDSGRYDWSQDEVQKLLLGLLTAASIDAETAANYWAETFPEHPDIPVADLPSYLRLHGRVIGMQAQIITAPYNDPVLGTYFQRITDALRDGTLFS